MNKCKYLSEGIVTLLYVPYFHQNLNMLFYFLDVVEQSWTQRHSRDIIILVIAALVAVAGIMGFMMWRKKQHKKQ